jgi:tetratricopeptide (TPR) repeat protein
MGLENIARRPRRLMRRKPSVVIPLADRARDARKWELAAQLYREVLERDPDNPQIWVQYGHALKEWGELRDPEKLAQAEEAYRRALSLDPGVADTHLQLGHVLKLQVKPDDARAAYLRAFALDPELPYPIDELGGLGWSEAELSELRGFAQEGDRDLSGSAPAILQRAAGAEGTAVSVGQSAAEPQDRSINKAFSISPVAYPVLAARGVPEGHREDEFSVAQPDISPTGIPVQQRSLTTAEWKAQIPLPDQTDLLKSMVLAQRWDLEGVKEQLRDAVAEKRQVEAALTARISALENQLQDVYVARGAASPSPTPNDVLSRFFGGKAEYRGQPPHPLIDIGFIEEKLGGALAGRDTLCEILLCRPKKHGRISPHWLFDPEHYEGNSAAAAASPDGPFLFYLSQGWRADESPHPLFDPVYYRGQAAARGLEVTDPLAHFVEVGGHLGLSPHPLFDTAYYLEANPDVKRDRVNPLRHYLFFGDKESRNPHRLFNTAYYKRRARIGSGENALLHYIRGGGSSVDPHECFDTSYFLSMLGGTLPPGVSALEFYLNDTDAMKVSPHPLFDQAYYRSQLPEACRARDPLLLHYLAQPPQEAAAPHPFFDLEFFHDGGGYSQPALSFYLSALWNLASDGYRLHKMHFPEANRYFCSFSYLLDHPDIMNGSEVPMVHYAKRGANVVPYRTRRPLDDDTTVLENDLTDSYAPIPYASGELLALAREQANHVAYLKRNNDILSHVECNGDDTLAALFEQTQPWASSALRNERLVGEAAGRRRLAIYAAFIPDGHLKAYHKMMLRALQDVGYVTVIVNGTLGAASRLAQETGDLAQGIIVRRGPGRDFASWVVALAHLAPALTQVDHLLLVNDSLIGPFGDLGALIKGLEHDSADFKGLTESTEIARHLQSSFLMLSRDGFFSEPFLSFLLRFVPGATRKQVIEDGEIGLSRRMVEAGVATTAQVTFATVTRSWLMRVPQHVAYAHALSDKLEETRLDRVFEPEVARRFAIFLEDWLFEMHAHISRGGLLNPQHICWDALVQSGWFPFLKKDLILINPLHVPTMIRICDFFPPEQRSEAAELLRDLVGSACGFPRSYFRVSSSLIEAMVA